MVRNNIALMKVCVEFLESLTDAQLRALISGKSRIGIDPPPTLAMSGVSKPRRVAKASEQLDIDKICTHLNTLMATDDAREYIASLRAKKADLLAIAKHLTVHVTSKDNIAAITERIIENTVGHRVRSRAIFATKI